MGKIKKFKEYQTVLCNSINDLATRVVKLNDKVEHIDERTMALDNVKVNQILNKTKELDEKVKILMERTTIDYSKPKYTEAVCIQNVYNRMANRGATREELDGFRNLIHKYNALEYTAIKEDNGND